MSDDFDGCSSSSCRPRNRPWKHTYAWGLCAHAPESARPELRVGVLRVRAMEDGDRSIVTESCTVTEMAGRIEEVLRTVPVRLGPNALAILARGGTVGLSGGEYAAMALAVATMLTTDAESGIDGATHVAAPSPGGNEQAASVGACGVCRRVPDLGVCPVQHSRQLPAGGHCACACEETPA